MVPSSFNPGDSQIESKIVAALERVSEAFRVLLWQESKTNKLSPIQIQLLVFLLFHQVGRCTISKLADEFNLTKATISDSVRVLLQKGLVEKNAKSSDTRSFSISLSEEGKVIAQKSAYFADSIEKPLHQFSQEQKEMVFVTLLKLIEKLNLERVITIQRMCLTCRFYTSKNDLHHCGLLQKKLLSGELRVDCPEHQIAS